MSNLGRIKNIKKNEILQTDKYKRVKGYIRIKLGSDNESNAYKPKIFSMHTLVALTFLGAPKNDETVDHINRIRDDNRVANLR